MDALQQQLDALFQGMFAGTSVTVQREEGVQETVTLPSMTDAAFAALGRTDPALMSALLEAKAADSAAWRSFQAAVQTLKLTRQRTQGALTDAQQLLDAAQRAAAKREGLGVPGECWGEPSRRSACSEMQGGSSAGSSSSCAHGGQLVRRCDAGRVCMSQRLPPCSSISCSST